MSLETIAARYAEAVYELGLEQNNLAQLADELHRVADSYASSDELRAVLDNPLVAEPAREALLRDLCAQLGVGPVAQNTVGLLASRHRLVLLPLIARSLAKQSDARAGVLRARVASATPLSDEYVAKLQTELERSTGKRVIVDRTVDPTLLGGVVTRIGDRVIDGSLRAKLDALKNALAAPA